MYCIPQQEIASSSKGSVTVEIKQSQSRRGSNGHPLKGVDSIARAALYHPGEVIPFGLESKVLCLLVARWFFPTSQTLVTFVACVCWDSFHDSAIPMAKLDGRANFASPHNRSASDGEIEVCSMVRALGHF
jgi:hypothetical protein